MKPSRIAFLALLSISAGCAESTPVQEQGSLSEARSGFRTKLAPTRSQREPVPDPPPRLFRKVYYDSPAGKLAAYISQTPQDGEKRPAIVWITGGDCNTIDDSLWHQAPASNDQTASAYWRSGVVTMFPSLRGGNDNPGSKEGFLGEVNDVLAAADYLARQESVDPKRLYLGGHSTGGTLALLVAESTDRFRGIFSFGPASDVSHYESQFLPFDTSNPREIEVRSPGRWLSSVRSPTFVFEGTERGNLSALEAMQRASANPLIHFHPVRRADHFSILAPTNGLIARKILEDSGPTSKIAFSERELNQPFER
jgi:dipeptidyl aminopeptidase/acylaminoacyl peptidase